MKRRNRFLLHALLPPLFGGSLIFVGLFVTRTGSLDWGQALPVFAMVIGAAYVMAIVPSLAYAALMEWAFSRRVVGGSRRALALSALLGTAVGSIPLVSHLFSATPEWRLKTLAVTALPSAVGCVVGVLVEALVAALARRRALTAPPSGPG